MEIQISKSVNYRNLVKIYSSFILQFLNCIEYLDLYGNKGGMINELQKTLWYSALLTIKYNLAKIFLTTDNDTDKELETMAKQTFIAMACFLKLYGVDLLENLGITLIGEKNFIIVDVFFTDWGNPVIKPSIEITFDQLKKDFENSIKGQKTIVKNTTGIFGKIIHECVSKFDPILEKKTQHFSNFDIYDPNPHPVGGWIFKR